MEIHISMLTMPTMIKMKKYKQSISKRTCCTVDIIEYI